MSAAIKHLKPFNSAARKAFSEIKNENAIFKLATTFTPIFLMASSALLYATELFGSPIKCITSLPKNVINTYCWISSTFTIQDFVSREVGTQAAQPGVFTPDSYDMDEVEKKWVFHSYYQWVPIVLTLMAAISYTPKYFWKIKEGGILRALCSGLSDISCGNDKKENKKKIVVGHIITHLNNNSFYAYYQWVIEGFSLFVIILQMALMDNFLGGEFWTYGPKVFDIIAKDQVDRVDPMIYVFPRMTKCNFYKYGPSGSLVLHDNYCVLPQNIVNEKIFVFAWFWFVIIACLMSILVMYRILLVLLPSIRPFVVHQNARVVPVEVIKSILDKGDVGDFWMLNLLAVHLDSVTYKDIIASVAKSCNTFESKPNGKNVYPQSLPSAPRQYECSSV